jgi:hypothetical protein
LLARNGYYAELYNSQFDTVIPAAEPGVPGTALAAS